MKPFSLSPPLFLVHICRIDATDTPGSSGKPQRGIAFTTKLSHRLQAIQDMNTAIQSLLDVVDLAEGNPEALMIEEEGRIFVPSKVHRVS